MKRCACAAARYAASRAVASLEEASALLLRLCVALRPAQHAEHSPQVVEESSSSESEDNSSSEEEEVRYIKRPSSRRRSKPPKQQPPPQQEEHYAQHYGYDRNANGDVLW